MNIASLFSSAGIAESRLNEIGISTLVSNELLERRCNLYAEINPESEIILGDISSKNIEKAFTELCKEKKIDVIMATPPCQGMSVAGSMNPLDQRNHLIKYAIDIILELKPKYVFLENVPRQLKTKIAFDGNEILIPKYIQNRLSGFYNFSKNNLIKAMDHGVPQMRQRNIILCSRKEQKKYGNSLQIKKS